MILPSLADVAAALDDADVVPAAAALDVVEDELPPLLLLLQPVTRAVLATAAASTVHFVADFIGFLSDDADVC